MWRAGFGLVVAVACASCLDVPRHRTTDGGPVDGRIDGGPDGPRQPLVGLSVTGDPETTAYQISTPSWRVRLPAPAQGIVRLPDQIEIGGVSVLGANPDCVGEDRVGLAIYPALSLTGALDNGATTMPLQVIAGPATVEINIPWQVTFPCPANVTATGATGLSFYPDGRIVRYDFIRPGNLPSTTDCGCLTGGAFYLTSFVTILNGAFTRLRFRDTTGDQELPVPIGNLDWIDDTNPRWACLDDWDGAAQSRRMAVLWQPPLAGDDNATRIKPDIGTTVNDNLVLLWDWIHSNSMVMQANYDIATTWYLTEGAAATCDYATIEALSEAVTLPAAFMLDDGVPATPGLFEIDPNLGLYRYDPSPRPDPLPTTYTLSPMGPIPAGFAISVLLPTDAAPSVRRDGTLLTSGFDYLENTPEDVDTGVRRHYLWFRDGLPSETLTISQP